MSLKERHQKSIRHQSKRTPLQLTVLYHLATNGDQSISSIARLLTTNRTNIATSIKILSDEHYVKFIKKIHGIGSPEKLYKITYKGIETLSKDNRISLKEFWEIAFCIFHNKKHQKISFIEYLNNYRNHVLQYDSNLILFGWGISFDLFDFYYKKPLTKNLSIKILQFIALKGDDTHDDILNHFSKKQKTKNQNILCDGINGLIQNKLILIKNDNGKYRLSSLGLLLLMNYYRRYLSKTSEGFEHKKVGNEVSHIIKNSKDSIPVLSEIWEDLIKVVDTSNLILKFDHIASKNIPISHSIQLGGMKEVLVSERIIRETYRKLLHKEHVTGLNVCTELIKQKKISESGSEPFEYLQFLGQMDGYVQKKSNMGSKWLGGKTFDETIDKAISEIILFEFITNVIEFLKNHMHQINLNDPKDPINDWVESYKKNWDDFLKKHNKLKIWYQNWISEIRKFEEKNLEIFKKYDFTSVN